MSDETAWMFQDDTPDDSEADPLAWMFGGDAPVGNMEIETARQLDSPKVYERRNARRQFVSGLKREALTELIPQLPPPDTDLYVIGNGAGAEQKRAPGGIAAQAFDFGSFLPVCIAHLGDRDCTAYVSSWTMNLNHVQTMLACLDDGRLKALTVVSDPYFKRREAGIAHMLINGLMERGQTFLCWKNHVKCIAIEAPDGRTCTITGSANLSAQPRCEQYVLTTAPEVYRFFRDDFFHAMTQQTQQTQET